MFLNDQSFMRLSLTSLLNQATMAEATCTWFLEIALVCTLVCVCLPSRALMTSGMIWCDIGCVRLIKQVLWFFLLLDTLYDTYHQ